MKTPTNQGQRGFALIEALVALVIATFAIFSIVQLQRLVFGGTAEARSRSQAITLAQHELERLRNLVTRNQFDNLAPLTGTCPSVVGQGANAAFTCTSTISAVPAAGTPQERQVAITVSWTGADGVTKQVALNSRIALDDLAAQVTALTVDTSNPITPVGEAQRGSGTAPTTGPGVTANPDGRTYTRVDPDSKITQLLDANGKILLYLKPKGDQPQSFTAISGRIYFDQNVGNNALPSSASVRVRLSSEGECIYNNAANALTTVQVEGSGNNAYAYFLYTCYVGPGWYGNVGVTVDETVNGSASSPTICVGDPSFNGGVSNSTLISPHPVESGVRTYRGYRQVGSTYLSTGVLGGTTYPNSGNPKPNSLSSFYGNMRVPDAQNHYNHHFLLTRINSGGNNVNSASCATKMTGGEFSRNAGKYYCISADNFTNDADACPSIWPGFENEVATSGGSTNYTLSILSAGTGSGSVASDPAGISCGGACTASFASGAQVTLTATPASGSTFGGWSGGGCSGTGPCTVTMSGSQSVTATFNTSSTYMLSVKNQGLGTVTSDSGGINCGTACSASYNSGFTVTLTAQPATGYTFTGWSGMSGTSSCTVIPATCTVSMNAAQNVTAMFASQSPVRLTVSTSGTGSGTVTPSSTGTSCGSNCWSYMPGTSVTLRAEPANNSEFTGWFGACAGTSGNTCTVTLSVDTSVTAKFGPSNCKTKITGSAFYPSEPVTVSIAGESCSIENNTSNFTCNKIAAPQGTLITLRNSTKSVTVEATCGEVNNVVFR